MAIKTNPIPEPVSVSSLSVGFQEVARIPNSSGNFAPRLNYLTSANDGTSRLFVNDMRGKLYVIDKGKVQEYLDLKALVGQNFLDASGQQGFISFTFDPDFKTNGIFYTVNSERKGASTPDFPVTKPIYNNRGVLIASSHHDVIRRWQVTNPLANTFSGTFNEIVRIEQPYADHNLGQIGFNPNAQPGDTDYGMLYIASADGGSNGFPVSDTDPLDNGQDLSVPLGKILRIDPRGNNSANGKYGIPLDNPFANKSTNNTLGEIWAYGLRNPHRFSWDTAGDGKMLIADIGQFFIEEVNLGIKGANYGWGNREGTFVTNENNEYVIDELPPNDAEFGYTYPVAQYDHDIRGLVAIAGGYVYRGTAIPELAGQYITADFANDGRFFHVGADRLVNGRQTPLSQLRLFNGTQETSFLNIVNRPRSDVRFGIDEAGEIYVTNKVDGIIRKIVRSPEIQNPSLAPGFYITDTRVVEGITGDLSGVFTVNLTAAPNNTVSVDYGTVNGVAQAGQDYTSTTGTLTFSAGEVSKTVNVSIINDNIQENDEFFTLNLSNPVNARLIQPVGTATIADTVYSSVNYTVGPGVENLTLTGINNISGLGNNNNNILIGNNGNNTLDGRGGADRMSGGRGNDHYVIDNINDRVEENFAEGNDIIQASRSYTLPENVENLTLTGTSNFTITGNYLDNRLSGNTGDNYISAGAGNDTLQGNFGRDTLEGGIGDDYYYVDNPVDRVIENIFEGTDTVESTISYILPDHTEHLVLTGRNNLEGTGNIYDNCLIGNTGNNNLSGGEGNDTLIGGIGSDTLTGGSGNDVYLFNSSTEGSDTIGDFSAIDDIIQIRASGFDPRLTRGTIAQDRFVLGSIAGDSNDRFLYARNTGKLFFDADGTGRIAAIELATLSGTPALDFNDIFII